MDTTPKYRIDDLVGHIERLSSKLENLEAKVGDVSETESWQRRLEDKMSQMMQNIDDKLAVLANNKRDGSMEDFRVFAVSQKRLEDKMVQMAVSIDDKFEALMNSDKGASTVDDTHKGQHTEGWRLKWMI